MKLAMSDISIDAWYAAAIFYDVKTDRHPMSLASALREDTVEWLVCGDVIPADKSQANTEVDKFVRDVFDARGSHRDDLIRACGPTASGYRQMVENGTCGANITGARDDQATRVGAPAAAVAAQRRAQR